MDPRTVKLPIILRLSLLKRAFFKDENSFGAIAIAILLCFSVFMAISTPLFLTNGFANFLLFIVLVIFYSAVLVGSIFAAGTFIEDQALPWYEKIKNEYEDLALPEKKRVLEEIDNILLSGKNDGKS